MIRIDKLNKYYFRHKKREIHVINDTSLDLPSKGFIALLGPSGCGKTTLLNTIGGLDRANKGDIYINDKKINRFNVNKIRNNNIGYIFQDYKLIDDMNVYENVALPLRMIGLKDKEEIKKRVEYILKKVGLERYKKRPCGMLSGGERQRVGIARAIVKNPNIILADEPTGNLDSANTIEVMNIIKAISRDKLVIMVTHEVDLAKFYSDRIIEIVDGKIVKDYLNKNNGNIDYKIDNKFYLKDFKYHNKNKDSNINIDFYSDNKDDINLVMIIKNGNLYIKNKDDTKTVIIDNNSNIELIDDKYKKLDKDVYLKYDFDYDKIINNNFKYKYSSIFNIFTIFSNGFKKVLNYSFIKKLLLGGFFLASLFVTYSISNVLGVNNIKDEYFITKNSNYLYLKKEKITVNEYNKYSLVEGINYIIPGDSIVLFRLDTNEYYQTENSNIRLSGSLSSIKMIQEGDLIYGRMPENEKEIVIDRSLYDNETVKITLKMTGILKIEDLLDRKMYLKDDILEYKIVGITDMNSPSIYTYEEEFINIISNSYTDNDNNTDGIYDYNLYSNKLRIVKGSTPNNDYEVIVNNNLKDTFKLGNYIDEIKINDNKLKVVGYYEAEDDINSYFVNTNTIKYSLIKNNDKGLIIYTNDKEKTINNFKELKVNVVDSYQSDKEEYIKENKDSMRSSIVVALIMLSISLIEIILMTRSSFLSRIKEVGIYLAIGVKRLDIYKMFIGESFAISTFSALPGVLIMSYCIKVLTGISYIANNYVMNIFVCLLCIILLYLFNMIVGLIPVFVTMRKTPAEILARHDLD